MFQAVTDMTPRYSDQSTESASLAGTVSESNMFSLDDGIQENGYAVKMGAGHVAGSDRNDERSTWKGPAGMPKKTADQAPPSNDDVLVFGDGNALNRAMGNLTTALRPEPDEDLPPEVQAWATTAENAILVPEFKRVTRNAKASWTAGGALAGAVAGGAIGAAIGACFGSVLGPVGTIAVGACCCGLGAVVGAVAGYLRGKTVAHRLLNSRYGGSHSGNELVRGTMRELYHNEIKECIGRGRDKDGQLTLPATFSQLAYNTARDMANIAHIPEAANKMCEAMESHIFSRFLCLGSGYTSLEAAKDLKKFGEAYLECLTHVREQQDDPSRDYVRLQAEGDRLATEHGNCVSENRPARMIATSQSQVLKYMLRRLPPQADYRPELNEERMCHAMGLRQNDPHSEEFGKSHSIHELRTRLGNMRSLLQDGQEFAELEPNDLPLRQAVDLQMRMCAAAGAKDTLVGDDKAPNRGQRQILDATIDLEGYLACLSQLRSR